MNYASFIYKMIYLNNSLKHEKKIMAIHVTIEKNYLLGFLRTSPYKRPRPSIHTEQQFRLDRKYTNVTGCDK